MPARTRAVRHCASAQQRRAGQETSREQALTPLHGSPWGAPHTQPHSLLISPAVSVGRWGACRFPGLQEGRK